MPTESMLSVPYRYRLAIVALAGICVQCGPAPRPERPPSPRPAPTWTPLSHDSFGPYQVQVRPGNTVALNDAKVPFARYLVGMHNRLHPVFADTFLGWLDGLPPTDPRNDRRLFVRLEIVLQREGNLARVGIVRSSGNTHFDMGALDSVLRAGSFGVAPDAILSSDGRVYMHWEFHRDDYACSTINARPFLVTAPPR